MNPDLGALLQQLLGASSQSGTDPTTSLSSPDMSTLLASNPQLSTLLNNVTGNLGNDQIIGGNQNVESLTGQTGAYSTLENQLLSQLGLSTSAGTNQSNSLANTTGATTTNGVTSGTTSGTSTTTPTDTLGMGQMLQSLIPSATNATAASNDFLTNAMKQGNPALQAQIGQATSAATSGPGMLGTGNGAMSRAAGDAASQVGINDFGQQISAAQVLGGPNAATVLSGAANPFIGSTGTTSGANTGTNNSNTYNTGSTATDTSGSTSNVGANLSNTVGQTGTSGVATGSSGSISQGETPTSSASSGGCYVCSVLASMGLITPRAIRRAVEFKALKRFDYPLMVAYALFGPWLARMMLRSNLVCRLMTPVGRSILYEELRLARGGRLNLGAWAAHFIFHNFATTVGRLALWRFGPNMRDRTGEVKALLEQEGLLFTVYE